MLGIDEPLAQKYIMEGSHFPEEMREALKPGVTRISFPYFMSEEVVEFVIEAVRMVAREGWKLLPQVVRLAAHEVLKCTRAKFVNEKLGLSARTQLSFHFSHAAHIDFQIFQPKAITNMKP